MIKEAEKDGLITPGKVREPVEHVYVVCRTQSSANPETGGLGSLTCKISALNIANNQSKITEKTLAGQSIFQPGLE